MLHATRAFFGKLHHGIIRNVYFKDLERKKRRLKMVNVDHSWHQHLLNAFSMHIQGGEENQGKCAPDYMSVEFYDNNVQSEMCI